MKKVLVFVSIVALFIGGFVLLFRGDTAPTPTVMTFSEYKLYIIDEFIHEQYPGLNDYDPNTLINVFTGLVNEDFAGLDTGYGVYEISNGGISFRPHDGVYKDTKLFLTDQNILDLINVVAKRLNQNIDQREGFETLITNIK